jgi:hypothetical protein
MKYALVILALPILAWATGGQPVPVPTPTVAVAQAVDVDVNVKAASAAHASNTATLTASPSSTATSTASSGGNTQSVTTARSAPALGQGAVVISGCGAGANGGKSDVNGGGFLGFSWVTQECKDFMLASSFASIGALQATCEVLNATPSGRRAAKRGVKLPDCATIVAAAPPVQPEQPQPMIIVIPAQSAPVTESKCIRAVRQCARK